jgi:MoaA/NifB/PqqE/SkfB family radical SAM enzyme
MGLTGTRAVLQVHPIRRCNLRCRHCYSSSGPWVSDALDFDILRRALDDAATVGYDVVSVSGGEPLLDSNLLSLLGHARSLGMRTTVTTNGMLLSARRLDELAGLVDVLAISLDGTPETHAWMRGDSRAFSHLARRMPDVRASGIPFGFISTLTMHNVQELEFVFEFAAASGAALVQVHPLEPEGFGADLASAVPDATELGFALLEAARLGAEHRIAAQVDLVTHLELDASPDQFLATAPAPAAPLGEWLSPLVIETDGQVVPLSYGFGRAFALGSLHDASLGTLAGRWDPEPLRALAADLRDELLRDDVRVFNWYERILRASHAVRVG